jgi:hypothetical protein
VSIIGNKMKQIKEVEVMDSMSLCFKNINKEKEKLSSMVVLARLNLRMRPS